MKSNDELYYRARAIDERAKAREASNAEVAAIHEQLAREYEAIVAGRGDRSSLRVVNGERKSVS